MRIFPASSPPRPGCLVTLAQSWITVVSSIESLTPELLESSCPQSPHYSAKDDEMFWALVHQGYSASFPNEAESAHVLRQKWAIVQSSVAEFHHLLAEMCPNESAKTLDRLLPNDHRKLLKQVLTDFQEKTGESFRYLDVWNLLVHHEKWEHVLKPLVVGSITKTKTGKNVSTKSKSHGKDQQWSSDFEVDEESSADVGSDTENRGILANAEEKASKVVLQPQIGRGSARRKSTPKRLVPNATNVGNVETNDDHTVNTNDQAVSDDARVDARPNKKQRVVEKPTTGFVNPISCAAFRHLLLHNSGKDTHSNAPESIPSESSSHQQDVCQEVETNIPTEAPALDDAKLVLAWINVSCSFADTRPRLEESSEWFWLLVSTIYSDLWAKPTGANSIEQFLKNRWHEIRQDVATFHNIFEEELQGNTKLARTEREAAIAAAQEAYWTKIGHWFEHRMEWELLERHVDWERVLKPLVFGGNAHNLSPEAISSHTVEQKSHSCFVHHRCHDQEEEETKSDGSVEPVAVSCVGSEESPATTTPKHIQPTDLPSMEPSTLIGACITSATSEKQLDLAAQWLKWSTHHLEVEIMTRSDDGLTPEACEFLRMRRQQILEKTRLQMRTKQ